MATTTLVGHSLGAHIGGLIANLFKTSIVALGLVAVLVALDPAGIKYRGVRNSLQKDPYRLRKGDARYTLVIHTSAFALGWEEPLGDGDIYPNYGYLQPCCNITGIPNPLTKYSKLPLFYFVYLQIDFPFSSR